jgi:hypothetical protein
MTAITIERFKVRYRTPREAPEAPRRLKQVMADTLRHGLEGAVERMGIGRDGYLCLREVKVRATLALRDGDAVLVEQLGRAIAGAIGGAAAAGTHAVAYASRGSALVDLMTSALGGDFSRSWAWAQLAIWPSAAPVPAEAVADLVVRALAREPRPAIAALASVARSDGTAFARLLERAAPEAWMALARTATQAAGWALPATGAPPEPEVFAQAPVARRIAVTSAIAQAVMAHGRSLPVAACLALGALAMVEAEPALSLGGADRARATLAAVARQLEAAVSRGSSTRSPDASRGGSVAAEERIGGPHVSRGAEPPGTGVNGTHGKTTEPLGSTAARKSPGPAEALRVPSESRQEVRRQTTTEFGGLLYLVNLVERLGLPETIIRDDRLSARGLRWVLSQLGSALAGIPPHDPAALAFAGLLPGARPPAAMGPPADASELSAIREFQTAVVEGLRTALDRREEPEAALLDLVCRRRAEIVGDPGWIEARFSLDDISLDVRRAGLDRDPGWVPWLGVVVRFSYA